MSKFVCRCGHIISDVVYPSPVSSMLFSEVSLSDFLYEAGKLLTELKRADVEGRRKEWLSDQFDRGYPLDASDSEIIEDWLSRKVNELALSTIRCDSCGRIHIQKKSGTNDYSSFAPDI